MPCVQGVILTPAISLPTLSSELREVCPSCSGGYCRCEWLLRTRLVTGVFSMCTTNTSPHRQPSGLCNLLYLVIRVPGGAMDLSSS